MRLLAFVFSILVGLSGAVAQTGVTVDGVRDDLEAARYDKLEGMFAEAHRDALDARDFAPLREVYSVLFVTAHRDRLALLQDWLSAHPTSPYAATALAWSHYYRAYQWRGNALARETAPEALQAFGEELERAWLHADFALEQAGDFGPALEAALVLSRHGGDLEDVRALVDRALAIAPDHHVLGLGLSALELRWGGSFDDNLALCGEMADKVPGYDAELCLIEMVFQNDVQGRFREAALAALDGRDEAFLDYARLDAYVNEWRGRDAAGEEARRIHRESLHTRPLGSYKDMQWRIEAAFPSPEYETEAHEALQAYLRERLPDNPQSTSILRVVLGDAVRRYNEDPTSVDLREIEAQWRELLDLGAHLPVTWAIGQEIDAGLHGGIRPVQRSRYAENQIYYSNYDSIRLVTHLAGLHRDYRIANGEIRNRSGVEIDRDALREAVRCPMIRASRLFETLCAHNPDEWGCQIAWDGPKLMGEVRAIMEATQDCTWEREAPLEELLYTPTPVEAFLTTN